MDICQEHNSDKIKRSNKWSNDNIIIYNNIIEEYTLKRNIFNPNNGNSPNRFIHKLELRYKMYYNTLNNSEKL